MELVHDDVIDGCGGPIAQSHVGEDLRGAADDRGGVVDGGIASEHADVLRSEDPAEGEEFLVGEGFDRDGVKRAAVLAEGFELHGQRHQRLAGTGGGVKDDVLVLEDFQDRFFLMCIRLDAGAGQIVEEDIEDVISRGPAREQGGVERIGHGLEKSGIGGSASVSADRDTGSQMEKG